MTADQNILGLLSATDWIIFASSIAMTVFAVYWGKVKTKQASEDSKNSTAEYLIMGRQLTLPLFVATLVSTWYGDIFGITKIAYEHGVMRFLTHGIFWYICYVGFAIFLVKKIRSYNVMTVPQLIEKLFGPKSAKLSAVLIFFKALPVTYAIGIGVLINLLTGLPLMASTILGLTLVTGYSFWGGFRAVVFSDFVQFLFMYAAVICVVVVSFQTFGGLDFLQASLPATHFEWNSTLSPSTVFVWLFIAMTTVLVKPTFYQRCFAAKSDKVAVRGILIATVLWAGFDVCTTLIGMYARAVMVDVNPLQASFFYAIQVLPFGIKGLFIAGVLATILSTLDSFLFISSTIVSYDLLPNKDPKKMMRTHRLTFLLTSVFTLMLAMYFEGNIELMWRTVKGFFAASLVIPLVLGMFDILRLRDEEFVKVASTSMVTMLAWQILQPYDIDQFYIGCLTSAIVLSGLMFQRRRQAVYS